MLNTAILIWFYALIFVGTLIPLGLFGIEVYFQLRAGQPVWTRFSIEYAVLVALTVLLIWILAAMMWAATPLLALLFLAVFIAWISSMIYWIYDSLKRSTTLLFISEIPEMEVACE